MYMDRKLNFLPHLRHFTYSVHMMSGEKMLKITCTVIFISTFILDDSVRFDYMRVFSRYMLGNILLKRKILDGKAL